MHKAVWPWAGRVMVFMVCFGLVREVRLCGLADSRAALDVFQIVAAVPAGRRSGCLQAWIGAVCANGAVECSRPAGLLALAQLGLYVWLSGSLSGVGVSRFALLVMAGDVAGKVALQHVAD